MSKRSFHLMCRILVMAGLLLPLGVNNRCSVQAMDLGKGPNFSLPSCHHQGHAPCCGHSKGACCKVSSAKNLVKKDAALPIGKDAAVILVKIHGALFSGESQGHPRIVLAVPPPIGSYSVLRL